MTQYRLKAYGGKLVDKVPFGRVTKWIPRRDYIICEVEPYNFETMKKDELLDVAKKLGLKLDSAMSKSDIRSAIEKKLGKTKPPEKSEDREEDVKESN